MSLALTPDAVANLARRCFGEPNRALSTRRELRFGRRGSLAVSPEKGVFTDHEAGVSGGVLAMMVYAGAARTSGEAARILHNDGAINMREAPHRFQRSDRPTELDECRREHVAKALWSASEPMAGTVAEKYLRTARAVTAPLDGSALRYLSDAPVRPYGLDGATSPALIAAVVNPCCELIGVHLTYVRPDGSDKAELASARKMVGRVGGGHVPLIGGAVAVVAEGIESALSAWEAFLQQQSKAGKVGCLATLSAGGMANLQWPKATTALLIAPDQDASEAGEVAGLALARRAHAAGLHVSFIRPPGGFCDWNDAARAERVAS